MALIFILSNNLLPAENKLLIGYCETKPGEYNPITYNNGEVTLSDSLVNYQEVSNKLANNNYKITTLSIIPASKKNGEFDVIFGNEPTEKKDSLDCLKVSNLSNINMFFVGRITTWMTLKHITLYSSDLFDNVMLFEHLLKKNVVAENMDTATTNFASLPDQARTIDEVYKINTTVKGSYSLTLAADIKKIKEYALAPLLPFNILTCKYVKKITDYGSVENAQLSWTHRFIQSYYAFCAIGGIYAAYRMRLFGYNWFNKS